jgi:hypothetical protein
VAISAALLHILILVMPFWLSELQKLAVGGLPEKILTAFQSVLDEHPTEEAALSKCDATLRHVGKIEEDVESILIQGKSSATGLMFSACDFLLK